MGPKRNLPPQKGPQKPKVAKKKVDLDDFTVIIDTQILNETFGCNLITKITESGLKYQIRNQLLPQLISFERLDSSGVSDEENVFLLILKGHDVVSWIEDEILIAKVKSYADTYRGKKFSLLIFGFRKFLRGGNTKLSRVRIETELTRLQMHTRISHRLIEKADVLEDTIIHFGKAVAEIPAKKLKNDQQENENFYFANDNKDCVRVVDNVGYGRLWQQHLIKLPFITLETAEAIMSVYPMPKNLLDAFQSSSSPETLLKDLPVRRAAGPLTTNRRLGPEMSRKIYQFYHSMNAQELLSSN